MNKLFLTIACVLFTFIGFSQLKIDKFHYSRAKKIYTIDQQMTYGQFQKNTGDYTFTITKTDSSEKASGLIIYNGHAISLGTIKGSAKNDTHLSVSVVDHTRGIVDSGDSIIKIYSSDVYFISNKQKFYITSVITKGWYQEIADNPMALSALIKKNAIFYLTQSEE